ncbi:MAG: NAD+ synthase [Candidatus Omnitrophota bacterium]|jgi:NAD+ synthase (glutamine-hydrolysing)
MDIDKNKIYCAIAQMNPTVGDYAGNTAKILRWIDEAERKGADLVVFPEAALCGYPVWDLANKKQFVDEGLKCLKRIAAATKGKCAAVVLGFISRGASPEYRVSQNAFNSVAWLEKGNIRTIYHKQLLPTYDVFLEEIFFQPGSETKIVSFKDHKIGLTICEDIWDERYEVKPLAGLAKKKADLVLNVSASPYYRNVAAVREQLLKKQTRRHGFPVLYVNQVGGQDDLLFDGRSMFVDAKGRVLFRAPAFEEGLFFYDWDEYARSSSSGPLGTGPKMSCVPGSVCENSGISSHSEIYDALVMGVRDYFRKNGFRKAVIGLSGGIDSALVAAIAVDALGEDAVKGVTMPGPFSSEGSWKDAEDLARALGIEFEVRSIREKYEAWLRETKLPVTQNPTLAMENLQVRLRGMELMFLSNHEGRLVLTTGNKSELAMGYCTLYGDMAGGLAVIGDVYKTDVYRLARYRNTIKKVIPESSLIKAPSAELRPGQKDQDSLPPYDMLDEVLKLYIEKNLSRDEIIRRLRKKIPAAVVADIICRVDHNEYKRRQTPPILRVTEKAWFGRRMPITNRFRG